MAEKVANGHCEKASSTDCTPLSSMSDAREKFLYVPCIDPQKKNPDFVAVVNVDPSSSDYLKIVNKCHVPNIGDELHHSGWNTCGSCPEGHGLIRDKLIFPCLKSDRIYIFDTSKTSELSLFHTIEPQELYDHQVSSPHTSHCMATGEIMISTMGDGPDGNGKGSFIILDGKTFKIKDVIAESACKFGYDFWYQYKANTMISSQWGAPKAFKDLSRFFEDVDSGLYGQHLDVWNFEKRQWLYSIDLGSDGKLPLETRFLHDPNETEGYVGCALSSTIFRFFQNPDLQWEAEKVISVDPYDVTDWHVGKPKMPGVITDILISLCDNFLFFSNWVHGDIRCYNIKDRSNPVLVGKVWVGGSLHDKTGVKVTTPGFEVPEQLVVKGKVVQGGPQMLQLSKDGTRLYVTTSLFSVWDQVFYPNLIKEGSCLLKVDVNPKTGEMSLDKEFLVDFSDGDGGTVYLAHEVRYPGGDCTSDIYFAAKH